MKTIGPWCLAVLLPALAWSAVDPADRHNEAVFQTGFEGADALKAWEGAAGKGTSLVPGRSGSQSLLLDRPAEEGPGHRTVRVRLPLEKLRGARVKVEAMVKAENVARPPNPWNGVKCMLHTVSGQGQRWVQQNDVFGTFDWKPVRFLNKVPDDATEANLVLGLELTTGRVWFDDVKVSVIGTRRSPAQRAGGPVYKGHDLPRLRGAMIGPKVDEADLRVLGHQWKANHVRWQLIWGGFPHGPADKADPETYGRWLESELVRLDRLLPVCEEVGLTVLVDLHTPPGGRNKAKECRIFHEKRYQDAFLAAWDKIAHRYRKSKVVWGYDLVNEPVEGAVADGLMDWQALALKTAQNVRAIDPDHAIVVEPAPWGSPQSLDYFELLPVSGVVYSVHMYAPSRFTHQGIYGNPKGVSYPGKVDGKHFDREQLRKVLRPAIEYQRDYGVHIYLGEFSAIRWAPGPSACNYLRDCIEIFEEQGWDWAYHAFREWDGWSVEHGPDPNDHTRSPKPTDREQLLRSWFARNRRAR